MSNIYIKRIGITDLEVDAVVNAANSGLWEGGGVCGAIFAAAGSKELTAACEKYGHCDVGSAVITPGFKLKARFIIHAVGPQWQGGRNGEPTQLYNAYKASLGLAIQNECHSIGFPLISSGIYGYPKDGAWREALKACTDFIMNNPSYQMDITFAILDAHVMAMGEEILAGIVKESGAKLGQQGEAREKTSLRYIDWNIRCGNKGEVFFDYLEKKIQKQNCIATLQEVNPQTAAALRQRFGDDFNIAYSIDYRPVGEFDSGNRELGVMIMTSKDIAIQDAGVFERTLLPERTLYATLNVSGQTVKVMTFHAVTGSGFSYGKAVQFRSLAECVKAYQPDFVSMDANEPLVDAIDIENMVFFSQGYGDENENNGARIFFRELQNAGLEDSYKNMVNANDTRQPLAVSHIVKRREGQPDRECRYDFIFVKTEYKVKKVEYLYDEATQPGLSDHAMVVAEVEM